MEHLLRNRNQKHFGPPFSEWVNWGEALHMADLILEGKFNNQETTILDHALLQHMKKWTKLDIIPNTITTAKWMGK